MVFSRGGESEEAHTTGKRSGAGPGEDPSPSSWQRKKLQARLGISREGTGGLRNLKSAILAPQHLDIFVGGCVFSRVTTTVTVLYLSCTSAGGPLST